MKSELDCRGLACSAPVLQTKQKIGKESLSEIEVIVNNQAAKENVSRFLENPKFEVSVEEKGTDSYVHGKKTGAPAGLDKPRAEESTPDTKKIMVMVGTDRM
jgi:TusA-related sulfurtransferase